MIRRLLVANRSEIAIRVFRAATELGINTIAIYAEEDKLSLHRFKADEAYQVGRGEGRQLGPLESYLSIDEVIRVAKEAGADAIHPGYGLLSESPEFAEACAAAGITFIGPRPDTMRTLGNKVSARNLAVLRRAGDAGHPAAARRPDEIKRLAREIGYPVMLKASAAAAADAPDRERGHPARRRRGPPRGQERLRARTRYLEKLVRRARHVEVQILGDGHGNLVHLFERDCSIQRRNQKVVERAPAPYLDDATRERLCEAALAIGRATNYVGAGTVEFLMDADTGAFYFIEEPAHPGGAHRHRDGHRPRHRQGADPHRRGRPHRRHRETGIPAQADIRLSGHALQCRITTENPENNFIPDYGRISAYRGAMGFGIRVDGGTAYSGAVVTRFYDSLLEKVTAWAQTPEEAIRRMDRALMEFRIRGVATNLAFLHNLVSHPRFIANDYTTRFIDETPALFDFRKRKDRATKLLGWIADVTVNGHPETAAARRRPTPANLRRRASPPRPSPAPASASKSPHRFGVDAPASARHRHDHCARRPPVAAGHPHAHPRHRRRRRGLLAACPSCCRWNAGAAPPSTWRCVNEDPWERLALIRAQAPNVLTQMLLRGANGGYTNYPDNVVRHFVQRAAEGGMDLFRIFDCLNWVDNMRSPSTRSTPAARRGRPVLHRRHPRPEPRQVFAGLLREDGQGAEKAGCHILAIKDMAGLLSPPPPACW
jgi:pyruvate carboxylase